MLRWRSAPTPCSAPPRRCRSKISVRLPTSGSGSAPRCTRSRTPSRRSSRAPTGSSSARSTTPPRSACTARPRGSTSSRASPPPSASPLSRSAGSRACAPAGAGGAVTLLERATPGAEACGAAAGMLTLLGESGQSPFENLAIASWRLYPKVAEELREQTGIDVEHVTRGTIYPLFTAEDVLHAEARAARHPAKDFGIEAWDAGQVRDREPALASRVRGA